MECATSHETSMELTMDQLDSVAGGGLLHFVRQFITFGNESTNTDPNLATHTASYTVSAS